MGPTTEAEVAKNIFIRAGLIADENKNLRTGILCAGGAQTGTFSAGVLLRMHEMGLYNKLDYVVAGSASAPNCGFFLSGKGPDGISYYWEENCNNFINPWRFWKVVDLSKLEIALRKGKPLDTTAVLKNPSRFFVTLTDTKGNGELYDVKSCDDIIVPIVATCGLPIFWNRPRAFNGKAYLDGSIALPLPVSRIARQFQLTDLLVVVNQPNRPDEENRSAFEKTAARCLLGLYSKELEQAYLNRKREYNVGLAEANAGIVHNGTEGGCRVAVLAPSYSISKQCTDVPTLKSFLNEGKKVASNFFSQQEKVVSLAGHV